jgi:hypothetical protein
MIPCHPGARGEAQNSQGWSTGRTGASRAVRGSKQAQFFSSGINLPPAECIRRRQIWYWRIARAGSYKGCIWASSDSPPLRRYGAQSRIGDSQINYEDPAVSCEKKIGARHLLARGNNALFKQLHPARSNLHTSPSFGGFEIMTIRKQRINALFLRKHKPTIKTGNLLVAEQWFLRNKK